MYVILHFCRLLGTTLKPENAPRLICTKSDEIRVCTKSDPDLFRY